MRFLAIAFIFLGLVGCTGGGDNDKAETEQWITWECDGGAVLQWRILDGQGETMALRLNDGPETYTLTRGPSASGVLYSDGTLTFHSKGLEGLVYWVATDDLIGNNCKPRSSAR